MAWSGDGRMPAVMKQLLEIERSLNNFMLETVLKLQTLTQTKVFLLLESKHYRRYCGNPEMVLCFENSDFQLDAKANQIDIEVTLDPAANTLRENLRKKRRRGHYRVGSALENEVAGVSPPKRARPNNGHHETAGEATTTTTASNEDLYIKQELDDDPHFTDDQVNEVLDHFERNDGLEFKRKLSSSTGHLLSALDEDEDENGELEGTEFLGGPPFREGMYSLENITKSQKFRTLEKVQDVSRAYIKGSWEFALLGSTMYDIGKELANTCPIQDVAKNRGEVKDYLNTNMNKYLQMFERFKMVEKEPFKDVLKSHLPESYMKSRIRGGFKRQLPQYYNSKKEKTSPKKAKAISSSLSAAPVTQTEVAGPNGQ